MDEKLNVSYAPHIRTERYISTTMRDVLIALVPALCGGVYFFGIRALIVTLVSVCACMLSEYIWTVLAKKKNSLPDLSAAVTGVLLAFCMPPSVPYYMVTVGAVFAIIIVKSFFGGLGQNIVNPALAARAFLLACWPVAMTDYSIPGADAVSGATPLAVMKGVGEGTLASYRDLFLGTNIGGCIGEVSALLILIGALYLFVRKVISHVIPITYILTVGVFGLLFSKDGFMQGDFLYSILAGGVMLGGVFMATDYTTSPLTAKGQALYAFLAGIITGVIRVYGGYPEGVTYAILVMNIATPLIDKAIVPKTFGKAVKEK